MCFHGEQIYHYTKQIYVKMNQDRVIIRLRIKLVMTDKSNHHLKLKNLSYNT